MNLIIKIALNALAIWAAAYLIDGIDLNTASILGVVIVAAVFGVINAIIKPIMTILTFPAILLTLGLFTFVINALLLWLTAALTSALHVETFWAALLGSIVISIVSAILSIFVSSDSDKG